MRFVCLWFFICFALLESSAQTVPVASPRVLLKDNWSVQTSEKVQQGGDAISTAGYNQSGWMPTAIPATVVSTEVANKVLPDPTYGTNMRQFPGVSYHVGENFSHTLMPVESPYLPPWWFRTEFQVPESYRGKRISVHFDGINYRANVWLNGKQIASADKMEGAYRAFEFDITDLANIGSANSLALQIFAPQPNDLAITFVDWNPMPPDKDMGIWKDVYLTSSGPVVIRYPQIVTALEGASTEVAHLTIDVQLENRTNQPVTGVLNGRVDGLKFSKQVTLAAIETQNVTITPAEAPQLNLKHPRLWWPVNMGAPELTDLSLQFFVRGQVSDSLDTKVGLRQVTSELTDKGARLFKINGKPILIRGAGWSSDMMLRQDDARTEQQIAYVKDMNLNTIRLEGKLENDHFFDIADRDGLLVMAGWCCCDVWEEWPSWRSEQAEVAAASLRDQILRLRSHPSVLVWLYGSDNPPTPDIEQMYMKVLKDNDWPNPSLSSAAAKPTTVTGVSGVKMTGPYDWVPPNYWLTDKEHGGAWGFNTETSPGPAVPPVQSLKRFIPPDHLWPIDDVWNYHAGGGEFTDIQRFTTALNSRYGKASGVEDYARKSQMMTYEGERAMFEAYRRNKYTSTGVIQWMLNNAWPSLIWHLYDYYMLPGGGYFGTKKANEPVHIQYSYDDRTVVIVNDTEVALKGLQASAEVYDINAKQQFAKQVSAVAEADSSEAVLQIPELSSLSTTYFVRLRLTQGGKLVSSNFYWLSTHPDVIDWNSWKWYVTDVTAYADYTALQGLSPARVTLTTRSTEQKGRNATQLTLHNMSDQIAFGIELRLTRSEDGSDIVPALWEDNYIALMPGEQRTISVSYDAALAGKSPQVMVAGWNVAEQEAASR